MDTIEPIVIKSVTNNDYFGDPGIIRSIIEAFVPHALGQPGRGVLFIHRKDADASVSISVEVYAATTEQLQELAQRTLIRLMNLPKLSFQVRFTEIVEALPAEFEAMTAPLEAESQLLHFVTGVSTKLAQEQRDKVAEEAAYEESMWQRLEGLPMPWEIRNNPQMLAEANYIVDSLMGTVEKYL